MNCGYWNDSRQKIIKAGVEVNVRLDDVDLMLVIYQVEWFVVQRDGCW